MQLAREAVALAGYGEVSQLRPCRVQVSIHCNELARGSQCRETNPNSSRGHAQAKASDQGGEVPALSPP